ncbi:MAG: FAD-dependent 5-carboxymethylaminomethyl-2-thiouridine(34) oxidoreductase MnmC, partial [Pseudomonadota bacterium]
CRLWQRQASPTRRLHYVACELHPFTQIDMERLHAHFPELAEHSAALLRLYPDHTAGVHQLEVLVGKHRVTLTLLLGDAAELLADYAKDQQLTIDAWFLDGFSPKKNPQLWEPALLQVLARCSHEHTTLSTYSVAGGFRAALAAIGFECHKQKGFTGKRHMLTATMVRNALPQPLPARASHGKTVCIVGGGLAGCSTAFALADSGWTVHVLEKGNSLASAGSGNLQGILHCKPGAANSVDNHFNLHAYLYSHRHYRALRQRGFAWHECGMLQVGFDAEQLRRFQRIHASGRYSKSILREVDAAEASTLAGVTLQHAALYFPLSGWLSPAELCRFYCAHPSITVHANTSVTELVQQDSRWQLHANDDRRFDCDAVILCNAADIYDFPHCRALPIISNRGQVDVYQGSASTALRSILCGQGYVTPAMGGLQSIGGSYYVEGTSNEKNRLTHLQLVSRMDSSLAQEFATSLPVQQRVGQRCQTPDRMPLVGAIAPEYPGLYLNVGHGSNGLARTPLSAALIASMLNATPPPLAESLRKLVDPARFGRKTVSSRTA